MNRTGPDGPGGAAQAGPPPAPALPRTPAPPPAPRPARAATPAPPPPPPPLPPPAQASPPAPPRPRRAAPRARRGFRSAPGRGFRPGLGRGFRPGLGRCIGGLAVTAVALAAAAGVLAVLLHGSVAASGQRAAVLAAARQEAINLTTVDRQTGSRDFSAVLAGAAGSLKQQLSQGRGAFLRTLSSADVTSVGSVLDAGIVTMNQGTATVLLNVRATVRNKQTYAPETRLYHWQAALTRSGGRWLVTSLEFV